MRNKRRIIITAGEPAGIGPDLVVMLAQQDWPVELVFCGDRELVQKRAQQHNLPLQLQEYHPNRQAEAQRRGTLSILPITMASQAIPGILDPNNSAYVIATLNQATDACLRGEFAALVTGPVQKSIINAAGIPFTGHTEFLAARSLCPRVVMMLATDILRVALVTTHLPLRDVANAITEKTLEEVITLLDHALKTQFGISAPQIYVCGLNPHAGEDGHIGREEVEIIIPTVARLNKCGLNLIGPLAADTIFQEKYLQQADVILAMYHDQGLPVLKYQGFRHAVNITLGLPFIRTSVDHGTALDLVGTNAIDVSSFILALNTAINMVNRDEY